MIRYAARPSSPDLMPASDLLFFIPYGIYLIFSILSVTFYASYVDGKKYLVMAAFCVCILAAREWLMGELHRGRLAFVLLFACLFLLFLKNAPYKADATMLFFVFSARNMDFRRLARFTWILTLGLFCFVVMSSQLGWIRDYYEYWFGRTRHYLGFRYSLFGPTILFNIIALILYDFGRRIHWLALAGLAGLNYCIYYLTDSRLCYFTTLLLLVVVFIWKCFPPVMGWLKWWGALTLPLPLAAFSVIYGLSAAYRPFGWMKTLNDKLGKRLFLAHQSLAEHGLTWTGQKIRWIGNGLSAAGKVTRARYTYVDSMYVQVLQRYGVFFLTAVLILLTLVLYVSWKRKEYFLLVILSVLILHAMIDDLIFYLHYNTFVLLFGVALVKWREEEIGGYAIDARK